MRLQEAITTAPTTSSASSGSNSEPVANRDAGLYKAVDAFGSVHDNLGNLLRPGDSNYAEIELNKTNIVPGISNISIGDTQSFEITESTFLAPFGKLNGNNISHLKRPTQTILPISSHSS